MILDPYTRLFNALNEAKIAAEELMIQRNAAQNRAWIDYARGHSDGHTVGYDEGYTDATRALSGGPEPAPPRLSAEVVEPWHGKATGSL